MHLLELLPRLSELSRAEKLRAMQFLLQELAREEGVALNHFGECEIWSPLESFGATTALNALLAEDAARRAAEENTEPEQIR